MYRGTAAGSTFSARGMCSTGCMTGASIASVGRIRGCRGAGMATATMRGSSTEGGFE